MGKVRKHDRDVLVILGLSLYYIFIQPDTTSKQQI